MLVEGLQVRHYASRSQTARRACRRERALIYVFDEGNAGRRIAARPVGSRCGVGRILPGTETSGTVESGNDRAEVRGVQSVNTIVPVLPTERTDGDIQFHDVEELAVVAEELQLSVAKHIPSHPDSWSNLIAPTEADGVGVQLSGTACRQILFVEANPQVQSNSVTNRPRVLGEQAV